MRAIIPDRLWIGTAVDARDVKAVLDLGIAAVVDLAMEEKPVLYPREIIYHRIPMIDGGGNPPEILRLAIDTTRTLYLFRVRVLVACSGGMSRSPAIVAAALAHIRGTSPEAMLEEIAKSGPHDVMPALWEEVRAVPRNENSD